MKKLILAITLWSSVLANAQEFTVLKSIKQSPLNLSNVIIRETGRNFVSEEGPMGSSISFEILADYDSGYGWIQDAILQEKNISGDAITTPEELATIQILGVHDSSKEKSIRLGDLGAVGGSAGKIIIPVKVAVNGWSGRMQSHQWTYQIQSGRHHSVARTLIVTLDKAKGWSTQIQ